MRRIKEVIVVEGKHDTARLKRLFDCDTIETSGTGLNQKLLDRIHIAQKRRGVIILTDPDAPGNRIRDKINRKVPGCKNAFIEKNRAKTKKKVGIEHGEDEAILNALEHMITYEENPKEEIRVEDLYALGLLGQAHSATLRKQVSLRLSIGEGNAKTIRNRLNCLGITKEELRKIVHEESNRECK
ncbi:MAG: ribonuclease M5 [Solobacterium sp.]|nr:ribonuclease M5 [Solobacterium sp.]